MEAQMAHRKDKYVDHVLVRYTPRQAIKDAVGFVARFFTWSNLKHGFRSVIGGFKEFSVFFFAMILVQLLFWCPSLMMESRAATIKEEAYAAADYHIKIDGMSSDEWSAYYNDTFIITDTFDVEDRLYESYEYSSYKNGSGRELYEVRIKMNSDEESQSSLFLLKYPVIGENTKVTYSPRVEYLEKITQSKVLFVPIILVMGLLSALILLILYNIRINHYKFRYGVYMSFGADFEKLFHTATWELFSIALLTFIPAIVLAVVIQTAISLSLGGTVAFNPFSIIWAFMWLFLVIMLAVFPSVKFLATRTPTSLIVAGDNSNYVASPRVSFRIFRKSFPFHYELYGFWRFRRYYATLLLSSILFSSLFLCGFFINSMVNSSENTLSPEFCLKANSSDGIDPYLMEDISAFDGVRYISWENSLDATAINSYVLLSGRQRSGISSKTVKTDMGYADNNFKYNYVDETLYEQITREGGWKIEGDLSRVMNDENCVAVSEYINNSKSLNFKVGDTITLAIVKNINEPISYEVPDNKYILNQLLTHAEFDYMTVEIAAIVDSGDTDDRYMIAMNGDLFSKTVKKNILAREANIYLKPDLDYQDIDRIYSEIRSAISTFDMIDILEQNSGVTCTASQKSSASPIVFICSALILLIAPPVWFFSQSMFGAKRKIENEMLSSFGATDEDLKKLYLFSGVALAVPGSVATVLLGWGVTEFIYWLVNEFLTSLGLGADFRYEYEFSFIGLVICIIVSAVSAIASTYMPFDKWKKDRELIAKKHLGE
jgi:ABC-type lipoprotein release transport system permease subunit